MEQNITSKVAEWYETSIRYEKTMEDGSQKYVTEKYAVEAVNFTDAEASIVKEMSAYISGDFKILAIQRAPYSEVFFTHDAKGERWYRVKVAFVTLDEKSGKEKKSKFVYLMQANSLEAARKNIAEVLDGRMNDYEIASVSETKVLEAYTAEATSDNVANETK